MSLGRHSCPDLILKLIDWLIDWLVFITVSAVFHPFNGIKNYLSWLCSVDLSVYFLLSHNVFSITGTFFVVYGLPGKGDIQIQGPFYLLLSHNVFFPYFVVYFLPGNGDIQDCFTSCYHTMCFFPWLCSWWCAWEWWYTAIMTVLLLVSTQCVISLLYRSWNCDIVLHVQGLFYILLSHNVFSLLCSLFLAWEWWYTATRTAQRTCRPGSTTLSSPWSWRVRWGRGAGRPSSPSRSTSSTVAVSALSCRFGAYSCSWDLGRFHRI